MINKLKNKPLPSTWLFLLIIIGSVFGYIFWGHNNSESTNNPASLYVVETVGRGDVSSGIETTGEIVAAQKLDLNVYKQTEQIDTVSVVNGQHVNTNDVLISFDKSDAYVDTQSAQVSVVEAELALQKEQTDALDPNTEIRSKENQLINYQKIISDAEQDIIDIYRDFLNKNLEVVPHSDRSDILDDRTEPTLSGRYVSDIEGQYVIELYSSGSDSGFSYRVSGLESMIGPVIFGKAVNLGTRGLKIIFPNDTKVNDKWVVYVPNTEIATYPESLADYEDNIADLEKNIADAKVNLTNTKQDLEDLYQTDTASYRNLGVEQAESTLAEAQQRLYKYYDVVQDRDIVAPFSGTVEGMSNVVEGATPTGGSEDTIDFGTLISDEFLVTFSLGAVDVAKVEVGQKVLVTITSFSNVETLDAYVTEISSLPDGSGVAQYEVQALIETPEDSTIKLREGLLADIEVVEEEATNVIRIPSSAISYEQGRITVEVLDTVSEEQQKMIDRLGILRSDGGTIPSYSTEVQLGLTGTFYVEILDGLEEGTIIIVSNNTGVTDDTSVLNQQGFRPGGGGNRPE
ncbi:efflux RND transporter periplasmic adaptor subunit [Candidatus Kaiserbacteria bacterium]|nr:efflux RND transporter periplasmic adaptor subunit [Candidatus Kaiserbacteria bacterium]